MPVVFDEKYLPAILTAAPMSDDEFIEFCAGYPDYFIEVTAAGEILIMPPTHWLTGVRGARILAQLDGWAEVARTGLVADPSSGFFLPNGARRSPDAAFISVHQLSGVNLADRTGSWHVCPSFVIELRSQTDKLPVLRAKMTEWIQNGAELAWLIDPERRAVEIYRKGRAPEVRTEVTEVEGEGPVAGFTLQLPRIWDPTQI
jgi:Uma2 family endonuclease